MPPVKSNPLSELRQLSEVLDDALHLFDANNIDKVVPVLADDIPPSLFDQCIDLCRQGLNRGIEPIRTIHHLSCTGGTLITKCLAAMPNVMVLNEVDPLSTMTFKADKPGFTPTDILSLARQGNQKISEALLIELFLQDLNLLQNEIGSMGKRLLIRDHSHSHFLTGDEIARRPTLGAIVKSHFPTVSIVTVRDPIDSYLSLHKHGWKHFKPFTFNEYCRRYLAFLDAYENIPVYRYEDFVRDPTGIMIDLCRVLGLKFSEFFLETFDTFKFSGDSGRKGSMIEARSRREIGEEFLKSNEKSAAYIELISRLGYEHF